jgi:hypothetical protein
VAFYRLSLLSCQGQQDTVSSRRIDYYDNANGPEASSLVPSVNVVVVNDAGEVLMIRRTDNGNWAVPGDAIDLGEPSPRQRSVGHARNRESTARSPVSWGSTPTPDT